MNKSELPQEITPAQEARRTPERRKTSFDRSWLLRGVTVLGLAAMVEACGPKPEPEEIPDTKVEDLASHPENLIKLGIVKVYGTVELKDSTVTEKTDSMYNFSEKKWEYSKVRLTTDIYELHGVGADGGTFPVRMVLREERSSSALEVAAETAVELLRKDAPKITPSKLPKLSPSERYRLIGSVETVRAKDGTTSFYLQLSGRS